jgi:phospholipase/carboxylesterase
LEKYFSALMSIQERKIGPLTVLDVQEEETTEIIILMHGYGANKEDLFPLHKKIKAKKGTRWIFPDAPNKMEMGGFTGRAWFPILSSDIDYVAKLGGLDFSGLVPKGLQQANEAVNQMIDALNFPLEKITIGGFSQGAMLSTDVVLHRTSSPAGLVILSGTLVNEKNWSELAKAKSKLQFFQSHGNVDPVLPFQGGKKLESVLRNSGLSGEFVEFGGGHEIPDKVCKRLGEYLQR